ncbi:MAG: AAA family ATPase [Actinomycetia bacterium]|nr:AAA family ATPase [Actinomycetes bacterium]
MKIKEFSITHYGPLPDTGKILLDKFNLFFGKNEDGKTLTIDAFVKLLLGRNMKDFRNINRVDEKPEGYIIIEDDKGEEIKLSRKKDLTKTIGLTTSECRNIFIIRDSDLSIANESEFYTNVTDRLTGLRTKEISSIKKKLQELGRLTRAESNSEFSDKKDFEYIKSRVNDASQLLGEINILKDKIKEEKFDLIEEESVKHREKIEGVKQEVVNLENARKREKYEKGKESLDKLTVTLEKFNHLEIYNENDMQLWRDGEKEVKTYSEEKEGRLKTLQQNEEEFKEINGKLSEVERDFQVFDDRKKKLDNEIKPELKNYETKSGDLTKKERINRYFTSIGIISAILFGISLLGVIFKASLPFYILAVFFLILTVILGVFKFQLVKEDAWLAKEFERIKLNLSKYGLDAKDMGEILSNIQKFNEEYDKKNSEIQDIKRKKENLEGKINELRNTAIPNIDKKMKDAGDKIDEIKIKSGEKSLGEYTEKIKSKHKLERLIEEQKSVLESHFEGNSEKLEESISQWEKAIGVLAEYKEKSREIKYSEAAVSEFEEKKRGFEEELEEINDKMELLQKEMEYIQRKVNEILRAEEEYLYCKTSIDLEAVEDRLQRFININESNKDNALEAIKIFEEIEVEEKEKVSELFGEESSISKYFNEITDGFYKEVTFRQETGGIEVKRMDGEILGAEKLSGGAHDQLYFSIRLALGEKLLKGNKGFFILDDPFVKADPDRLKRQINTLKNITKLGWQVLYFSAKGEIYNGLKMDIENGTVNYIKFQGLSQENI